MQVSFYKIDNGRLCGWRATRSKGKRFEGTTMASGRNLPHDLAQFVVESALGVQHGFWNLLANGASFKSVPGRRRTKPGQQLVGAHRDALNEVEGIVNSHVSAWQAGAPTPVGKALDEMIARWRALLDGEEIILEWATIRLPRKEKRSHGPSRPR